MFVASSYDQLTLCSRDWHGLDIMNIHLHTKNEVSRLRLSKVRPRTRHTDRCHQIHYYNTLNVVVNFYLIFFSGILFLSHSIQQAIKLPSTTIFKITCKS